MKFETNKEYKTTSICDHTCVIAITVAKRTPKTIVTTEGKRFRIGMYEGVEYINPWGVYSMSPVIRAA